MKKSVPLFIMIISLLILFSCNSKKETSVNKIDLISEAAIVETEQTDPLQNWKELLLSDKKIVNEEDIKAIKAIIEKAVENNNLEELQIFLETEAVKDKVPPQILFGLSLVYGRKGLVKEEYKIIERLEEQVKQRPGIAFNLSLVYGRKETLKSQIDKAEEEALALLQGFIYVTSEPSGADVFINGELKGTTPFTTEGLGKESYSIEIRMEDYTVFNKTVSVKAGKTTEIEEELVLMPGSLVINSDPVGSTVLINGEKIGITPLEISEIEVGEYELTISKNKFKNEIIPVSISPGKQESLEISLKALIGNLYINDLTEGAVVYLSGKRVYPTIGITQQRRLLKDIPVGNYTLVIQKNNYISKNLSISIDSGQNTIIDGELEKDIYTVPFAKIRVDGKSSDWDSIEPIYQYNYGPDPFPDDNGTDYKNFKVAYDDKNLFYIIEFNDPPSSRKEDYYYQINIYQTASANQHDYNLNNGDIRVNHNIRTQPGGTFIWDAGKFVGTQDTYVRGSTYLEGSIPRKRITFSTDLFYISCVLNKKPGNVWQAEFIKITIP